MSHSAPVLAEPAAAAPRGIRETQQLVLLALGSFAVSTAAFLIAGVLPQIALTMHVSATTASNVIVAYALTFAISSPFIAIAVSRAPRRAVLIGGLLVMAIGTAMAAVAPNYTVLLLTRVLAALGAAAYVPMSTATAAAIAAPERRGRAIAIVSSGLTAAVALGAPLGTALAALGGWRTPLLAASALSVLVIIGMFAAMRKLPAPAAIRASARFTLLRSPRVTLTLLAILVLTAAQYAVYNFLSQIEDPVTRGSGTTLALMFFVYGVAATLGSILAGIMADRIGNRIVVLIGMPALAAAFVVLPFASHALPSALVLEALWGFFAWATTLGLQHRLVQASPDGIAWMAAVTFLGVAASGPLGAASIAAIGASNISLLVLIPLAGAFVLSELSARSRR